MRSLKFTRIRAHNVHIKQKSEPKLGPLIIASLISGALIALVSVIPVIGGLLRSLLKTILFGVSVLVVIGGLSPTSSLTESYGLIRRLWEDEGIAVILIFLVNLIAVTTEGILGLVIRVLGEGEPYAVLIVTYYYLKGITGKRSYS